MPARAESRAATRFWGVQADDHVPGLDVLALAEGQGQHAGGNLAGDLDIGPGFDRAGGADGPHHVAQGGGLDQHQLANFLLGPALA